MPIHKAAGSGGIYWLASYPKSGNTWFRAFLTALLDTSGGTVSINRLVGDVIASSRPMLDDILSIETANLAHDELDALRLHAYDWHAQADVIQFWKTHDTYAHVPTHASFFSGARTRGALYLVRNPLDVACSFAHHSGISIDAMIDAMADPDHALSDTRDKLVPSVRQHLGSWSQHVTGWTAATDISCTVLRYEDLHLEPLAAFSRAAHALGIDCDAGSIGRAIAASSFSLLRAQEEKTGFTERPAGMTAFFRRGQANAWRRELSDRQAARIIADHAPVMRRFGYLDQDGNPR